jgi:heme exporter protein D
VSGVDWQAFFAMGGYGTYVWGAYLVVLLVVVVEVVLAVVRRRNAIRCLEDAEADGEEFGGSS